MPVSTSILAEAERIERVFLDNGAVSVRADVLQSAATLLDLYGEDIRARAYVTQDPLRGEAMLRPDFTVPVVQMHMAEGAEPARYTYLGKVFRKQEEDATRPSEYLQVGYELFDRTSPVAADAEVFDLALKALHGLPVRAMIGDIGVLSAAVRGLDTSERRKAALMRHIWRPIRFRALLNRFAGRVEVPKSRKALLAASDPFAEAAPFVGLRDRLEVEERIEALRVDAAEPPISDSEMASLDALLKIKAMAPDALEALRDLAVDMPQISGAVERVGSRLEALANRGVDISVLQFETAYGRASLEYYDGFVFGLYDQDKTVVPALATGGRYDALTEQLGGGRSIPAVGVALRPDLTLKTREALA